MEQEVKELKKEETKKEDKKEEKKVEQKKKSAEEDSAEEQSSPGWRSKSLNRIDELKKELREVKEVHKIKEKTEKSLLDHVKDVHHKDTAEEVSSKATADIAK